MLKLVSMSAAIGLAATVCSLLAASAAGMPNVEIARREQQLYGLILVHDTNQVSEIVTQDYTMTTSTGHELNRADFLASVADRSSNILSFKIHSETVRLYGSDTAVVVGLLDEVEARGDVRRGLRIAFLETWVRQAGGWQLAASQLSFPLSSIR
jgi:hypothetical protein